MPEDAQSVSIGGDDCGAELVLKSAKEVKLRLW